MMTRFIRVIVISALYASGVNRAVGRDTRHADAITSAQSVRFIQALPDSSSLLQSHTIQYDMQFFVYPEILNVQRHYRIVIEDLHDPAQEDLIADGIFGEGRDEIAQVERERGDHYFTGPPIEFRGAVFDEFVFFDSIKPNGKAIVRSSERFRRIEKYDRVFVGDEGSEFRIVQMIRQKLPKGLGGLGEDVI